MDELDLIKRRHDRIAPARQAVIDEGHARLLDAMRGPAVRTRRRFVLRITAVAVAAAGLVAALVVPLGGDRAPGPVAEAAEVARRAEIHTRGEPVVVLRENQWVHVRTMQHLPPGTPRGTRPVRQVADAWTRMDGVRWPRNRVPFAARGMVLAGLPDQPTAALSRLYAEVDRIRALPVDHVNLYLAGLVAVPRDEAVFNLIEMLLRTYGPPPRVQAALYGALSRLPHVKVLRDATDASGRHGIALYIQVSDDQRNEVILDPSTYRYLGSCDVITPGGSGPPRIVYWSAQLSAEFVQHPGERN